MNARTLFFLLACIVLIWAGTGCSPAGTADTPLPSPQETAVPSEVPTTVPTEVPIPESAPLVEAPQVRHLYMQDENHGWALLWDHASNAGGVARSVDGGLTWYDVTPAGLETRIRDALCFFLDYATSWMLIPNLTQTAALPLLSDGGLILSYPRQGTETGTFYSTTNGGADWTFIASIPFGSAKFFFIDNSNGWAVTSHSLPGSTITPIFQTTSGGQTWLPVYSNDPANPVGSMKPESAGFWTGIVFIDTQNGFYTSGGEATVNLYNTADGGSTWLKQDIQLPNNIGDVSSVTVRQPIFFD